MCITGAERKMYLHPNMYKQLVAADHDHDLIETVKMGKYRVAAYLAVILLYQTHDL